MKSSGGAAPAPSSASRKSSNVRNVSKEEHLLRSARGVSEHLYLSFVVVSSLALSKTRKWFLLWRPIKFPQKKNKFLKIAHEYLISSSMRF
jgi:hypothetical protein